MPPQLLLRLLPPPETSSICPPSLAEFAGRIPATARAAAEATDLDTAVFSSASTAAYKAPESPAPSKSFDPAPRNLSFFFCHRCGFPERISASNLVFVSRDCISQIQDIPEFDVVPDSLVDYYEANHPRSNFRLY